MLLPNGQILAGYYGGTTTWRFNPGAAAGSQWQRTAGSKLHGDQSDEETWVKLPDNSILSYDVYGSPGGTFQAQRYIPAQDKWVDASSTDPNKKPGILSTGAEGNELGPGLLLPDGRVVYFGTNGNTAFYDTKTDRWSAGVQEPQKPLTITPDATSTNYAVSTPGPLTFLVGTDDPAAMLQNGHVLVTLSPQAGLKPKSAGGGYSFPQATYVYDFDPKATTTAAAFTEVTPSNLGNVNAFKLNMVTLPTGQILMGNQNGGFQIYTPDGEANNALRPVITGISPNGDNTYTLTGMQLNGASEGSSYGDDLMSSSNYPILQLQAMDGTISYARTYNWSDKGGVGAGESSDTVQFTLPPGKTLSDYAVYSVIANGIARRPSMGSGLRSISASFPTRTMPRLLRGTMVGRSSPGAGVATTS